MRWVYSLFAVLLLALASMAGAADYRLTVDGSPADLVAGRVLVLYGSGLKKGDRVVELQYGAVGSERSCRVAAVEKSDGGVMVTDFGAAKGFGGKIVSSSGQPSGKAVQAALTLVATAIDRPDTGSFFGSILGFFTSLPGLLLLGGVAVVVGIWLTLKGRMSSETIHVPSSRRRTWEDALRDIADRLDQIDEAQKELVRKPPLVRSFKAQIDGFQEKLDRLESLTAALEAGQAKNTETVVAVDQSVRDLGAKTARTDEALGNLAKASTEMAGKFETLAARAEEAERTSRESSSRSAELVIKLSKQEDELSSRLFAIQGSQQKSDSALTELQRSLAALSESAAKLSQSTGDQFANLSQSVKELESSVGKVSDLSIPDPSPAINELKAGLDSVAGQVEELQGRLDSSDTASQSVLQSALGEFSKFRSEFQTTLSKVSDQLGDLDIRSEVQALAKADQALSQSVAELQSSLAGLKDEELRSAVNAIAAQHAEIRDHLSGLKEQAAALEQQAGQQSQALEKRFEEVAARFDQRSETVLSIEKQLREQSNSIEFVDFTPAIGDLRAQVQSLAVDQSRIGQGLEDMGKSLEALRAANVQTSEALQQQLAQVGSRLDTRPVQTEDGPAVQVIDLTPAIADLKRDLQSIATEHGEFAKVVGKLAEATDRLSAESAGGRAALEQLRLEVSTLPAPVEVVQPAAVQEPKLELVEVEPVATVDAEPAAIEGPAAEGPVELVTEPAPAPAEEPKAEVAEPALAVSSDQDSKWSGQGGSSSRHWSVQSPKFEFDDSVEELKPLTPTETAPIDFPLGALAFSGGKVVYANGESLRGFWPGKGSSAAALKAEVGAEAWRLVCLDGRGFCVQQDQVEVISLTSWVSQSRFAGKYLDQVCTDRYWAGLLDDGGQLAVDFREVTGKQVCKPVAVGAPSKDARTMAAEGGAVFVGTSQGSLFRVTPEGAEALNAGVPADADLVSLSVWRDSLLTVAKVGSEAVVFQVGTDGSAGKQLPLGFAQVYHHPVIVADRMYLVGSEESTGEMSHLLVVNLKKMEKAGQMPLPGHRVATFAGIHAGGKPVLLLTLQEEGSASGRVILFDPKSGSAMNVCRVSHPKIEVIASEGKIIVATGSSYQNIIRVFDPTSVAKATSAAA